VLDSTLTHQRLQCIDEILVGFVLLVPQGVVPAVRALIMRAIVRHLPVRAAEMLEKRA
jgi:hypothetical protein